MIVQYFLAKLDSRKNDVFSSVNFNVNKKEEIEVLIGADWRWWTKREYVLLLYRHEEEKKFNADDFMNNLLQSKYTFNI